MIKKWDNFIVESMSGVYWDRNTIGKKLTVPFRTLKEELGDNFLENIIIDQKLENALIITRGLDSYELYEMNNNIPPDDVYLDNGGVIDGLDDILGEPIIQAEENWTHRKTNMGTESIISYFISTSEGNVTLKWVTGNIEHGYQLAVLKKGDRELYSHDELLDFYKEIKYKI